MGDTDAWMEQAKGEDSVCYPPPVFKVLRTQHVQQLPKKQCSTGRVVYFPPAPPVGRMASVASNHRGGGGGHGAGAQGDDGARQRRPRHPTVPLSASSHVVLVFLGNLEVSAVLGKGDFLLFCFFSYSHEVSWFRTPRSTRLASLCERWRGAWKALGRLGCVSSPHSRSDELMAALCYGRRRDKIRKSILPFKKEPLNTKSFLTR
jgi:hypothetical protein